MPTIRIPNNWRPRDYQLDAWAYLERGGRRADCCWHRRAGKDDIALHRAAVAALERVGSYWHMLPEAAQARKAVWEAINPHTGKRRIDEAFPPEIRAGVRESDMFIRFVNGSTWQVVGSDNYNSLVGSPPVGVVFSEWSLAKPEAWSYLRPILAENEGWAFFIWTPRGRNHATRAFEAREHEPSWFTQRLPATKTSVFTAQQLEQERRELAQEEGSEEEGEARFRQEYLVDFNAAVPGSYYGRHISDAQDQGRIGHFPFDRALPVLTAWDIGVDDYTAVWFLQENGQQVRAIGYYETAGIGPEQIVPEALPELMPDKDQAVAQLMEIGRLQPYKYGEHFLPHDVMVREWGAGGRTRFQTLRALGVTPIRVGVAMDPADRINAGRRLFPFVSFDAEACLVGLDRLRNYRKRWNRSLMVYTGPLHDENSHGADAFGEFAVNCRLSQKQPVEKATEPRDRYHKAPKRPQGSAWG